MTLLECGTHALLGAVFDGFDRASEPVLARRLLDRLEAGMLLLADRNFAGHELWGLAAATGADLISRTKKNNVFVPVRRLPDGSFLSVMGTPAENLRHGEARRYGRLLPDPPAGHPVRIIEYDVTVDTGEQGARSEAFRLVTSLLDHEQAPAQQLAEVYHQRWEIELGYGELKTRLRGPEVILRSRSPRLVEQEIFAPVRGRGLDAAPLAYPRRPAHRQAAEGLRRRHGLQRGGLHRARRKPWLVLSPLPAIPQPRQPHGRQNTAEGAASARPRGRDAHLLHLLGTRGPRGLRQKQELAAGSHGQVQAVPRSAQTEPETGNREPHAAGVGGCHVARP
jgi:hypothetical protein